MAPHRDVVKAAAGSDRSLGLSASADRRATANRVRRVDAERSHPRETARDREACMTEIEKHDQLRITEGNKLLGARFGTNETRQPSLGRS